MNATVEQIERAKKQANQFVTFEKALKNIMKQDAKCQWSPMSKNEVAKMESRQRIENGEVVVNFDLAERNLENAKNNLPSSLR